MAITVTIDSVNRTDNVYRPEGGPGAISFVMVTGSDWYADFDLYDLDSTAGAYRPSEGDDVLIQENGADRFHGRIEQITDGPVDGTGTGTKSRVRAKSMSAVVDQIVVDKDYSGVADLVIANSSVANPTSITTNQPHGLTTGDRIRIEGHEGSTPALDGDYAVTVTSHSTFTIPVNVTAGGGGGTVRRIYTREYLATDLFTSYLDDYGITLDAAMSTGVDIESPVFKDVTLREALDYIATITGDIWRITPGDEFQFFVPGEKTTFDITAANKRSVGPITWTRDFSRYVNDVRLSFGGDAVVRKVDTITGDGSTNNWPLLYQPANSPSGFPVTDGVVLEAGVHYPITPLVDILTSSVANPTVITTRHPHGLATGDTVLIQSHTGSTPTINGTRTVTVTGLRTFTIPVNVTVAGTGGSVYNNAFTWLYYPTTNRLFRVGALGLETIATFGYSAQFPQTVTASDATEISNRGRYTKKYRAPEVFDFYAATELAESLLRKGLELPKRVKLKSRHTAFPMPGDTHTVTFANRGISGAHLVTQVSAIDVSMSGKLEYDLITVEGTEPLNERTEQFRGAIGGSGGSRTGIISGRAFPAPSGLAPGPVASWAGIENKEVRLDQFVNGDNLGSAVLFGRQSDVQRWVLVADDIDLLNRFRLLAPAALSGADYHVQFFIPGTTHTPDNDVVYMTPHGGGGGDLFLGGPAAVFGDETYRITNVYATDLNTVNGIKERLRTTYLGEWIAVSFSAGNFTANGSMTWTVASGDVAVNRYMLMGKTLLWNLRLDTTTVGGTANTQLLATIPGGLSMAHVGSVKCGVAIDNGTLGIDAEVRFASSTQVAFQKASGANWTLSTDQTYIWALMTIELA